MAKSNPIETPRLYIEPFGEEHIRPEYLSWLNDPSIMEFSDQRFRGHTYESSLRYLKSFESTPNYFWAIVCKDSTVDYIGTATAYVDEHHAVADIGILIGRSTEWGKGYASEALLGLCDYLFRDLALRKVTAGCLASNIAMLKVMERVGMLDDGRRVGQCVHNGQPVDVIRKALFRQTWLDSFPHGVFTESWGARRTERGLRRRAEKMKDSASETWGPLPD